MRLRALFFFNGILLLLVTGCASNSLVAEVVAAVYADKFGSAPDLTLTAPLNPAYRYLRVEHAGAAPALLVLGFVDADPLGNVEAWYSTGGEVVKLQNGRIVATAGLTTDWRQVKYRPAVPAWHQVPATGVRFTRVHDESPGYRAARTQALQLKPWPGLPPTALPPSLPVAVAQGYRWYQEIQTDTAAGDAVPAWYAVARYQGQDQVVYSEQCVSASLCLKLQLWPLEKAAL